MLALVVAADELLQVARERPETPPAPRATPAARARARARRRPQRPAGPARGRRQSLAAGFALEHYGGGQTQLGPDLAWRLRFTSALFVAVAGPGAAGPGRRRHDGDGASRLLGGRLALGACLYALDDRLTLTADARRARRRGSGSRGTDRRARARSADTAAAWLAYADATLAISCGLAGPLALRLAAGAGAPLVAQAAAEGTRAVTAASGLALEAQAAALMVF